MSMQHKGTRGFSNLYHGLLLFFFLTVKVVVGVFVSVAAVPASVAVCGTLEFEGP